MLDSGIGENELLSKDGLGKPLVFDRVSSMSGPRRVEMRTIQDLVLRRDHRGIAEQIRAMKKIWKGTVIETGMVRQREAEARLVEG